jgi:4-alpha-glucanotransferase
MSFRTLPAWQKIGIRHHHGVCVPVGSLLSASSGGIGEYLDLCPLIQFLSQSGFDVLQLLPIQDTGDDPSPYMGRSGFALHPIYLSLRALPGGNALPKFRTILTSLSSLNTRSRVCYREVLQKKLIALKVYLDRYLEEIEQQPAFQQFIQTQSSWLTPYALFTAQRELNGNTPWWMWKYNPKHSDIVISNTYRHCQAIQYLCFQQMHMVRNAAEQHHVLLLGDIPILMNKDSADVWWHQKLFSFRSVVGAPPDMYNPEGQKWGFPPFCWKQHEQDGFSWWKSRLKFMEEFFHVFRIDHIVGFFRLWAIAKNKPAKTGHFIPENPTFWEPLGQKILTNLVSATTMLPIGEDLGNIPDFVRSTMHYLGIPGLKVLRWERAWNTDRSFCNPAHFSPESLTTVSTHDSSTLSGWWEESLLDSKTMAECYHLPWTPSLPPETLHKILIISHQSGSLFHVNLFQEYLNILPELSWNNNDFDRINIPGTLSPNNWTFRYRQPIETICNNESFRKIFQSLSGK